MTSDKNPNINTKKLLDWILGSKLTNNKIDNLTEDTIFKAYDNADERLLAEIHNNLDSMKISLRMVKSIQSVMTQNEISLITLSKMCKSSDEMKIFEIINTGGEKLSNAQIRSAKKEWNNPVTNIDDDDVIYEFTKKLYGAYSLTTADEFVAWDFAATFTDRLSENSDVVLGSKYRNMPYTDSSSKDKLEFGFKLLSARYMGSVTKEKIDELPKK